MKKRATPKKAASKKPAAKPAAARSSAKPAASDKAPAKAPPRPAAASSTRGTPATGNVGAYQPKAIQSTGWAPFRYPPQ